MVAAGVMYESSQFFVSSGSELVEQAFAHFHNEDFCWHAHGAIFEPGTSIGWNECDSARDRAVSTSDSASKLISVEHLLPTTSIYEARLFIQPINSITRLWINQLCPQNS
ncbi:MAG: hypothetical protein U5N86_01735 [Planctomycetota bacterium]|nr:hypothetical protein [Planctomycetota bacterium]